MYSRLIWFGSFKLKEKLLTRLPYPRFRIFKLYTGLRQWRHEVLLYCEHGTLYSVCTYSMYSVHVQCRGVQFKKVTHRATHSSLYYSVQVYWISATKQCCGSADPVLKNRIRIQILLWYAFLIFSKFFNHFLRGKYSYEFAELGKGKKNQPLKK